MSAETGTHLPPTAAAAAAAAAAPHPITAGLVRARLAPPTEKLLTEAGQLQDTVYAVQAVDAGAHWCPNPDLMAIPRRAPSSDTTPTVQVVVTMVYREFVNNDLHAVLLQWLIDRFVIPCCCGENFSSFCICRRATVIGAERMPHAGGLSNTKFCATVAADNFYLGAVIAGLQGRILFDVGGVWHCPTVRAARRLMIEVANLTRPLGMSQRHIVTKGMPSQLLSIELRDNVPDFVASRLRLVMRANGLLPLKKMIKRSERPELQTWQHYPSPVTDDGASSNTSGSANE